MNVSFVNAAAAYAAAARKPAAPAADPAAAAGTEFSSMVKQAARTAVDTMKQGEAASLQALTGKADIGQVVTAVSNAEVTLQTAVAVRDRVIQAYLDIIRMPI